MDQYFTCIDPSIQWQVNEALRCENVVIVQWAIRASLSVRSLRTVLMACKFYAGDLAFFLLHQEKADLAFFLLHQEKADLAFFLLHQEKADLAFFLLHQEKADLAFFLLHQEKADLARQCGADCNLVSHSQATRTVTSGRESRR